MAAIDAEAAARAGRGEPPMDPSQLIAFVIGLRRNRREAVLKRQRQTESV
jgi:hypothetical protein